MPWKKVTVMSSKKEFIRFVLQDAEPFSSLCRRFNISTKTGYKYWNKYLEFGEAGLEEQSRRPLSNPNKTKNQMEDKIVAIRIKKPYWGGKKINSYLKSKKEKQVPAPSTITDILKRHGLIKERDLPEKAFERFEHDNPNDLWQIDFKGHFAMHHGRCHPLTILDDHSRFSIGLKACEAERSDIVKSHFIDVFEEYGLPYRINFDNGSPWASITSRFNRFTELSLWLIRLGINISYSRIRRPQTNGKIERFHRTLKNELLQYHCFFGIKEAQKYFDKWKVEYNFERPHEAINLKPPITRYKASQRKYPRQLPEIQYRPNDIIRQVDKAGIISYRNKKIFVGEGLRTMPIALRENGDGMFNVYFCDQRIACIDLKS